MAASINQGGRNNWEFSFILIHLFYILSTASLQSLSTSSPYPTQFSPYPTQFSPSPSRKGQVSYEYQQTMAHQVTVRLSTSPCTKVGQDDPVWEVWSLKLLIESETAPVPSVRSSTREASYTTVAYAECLGQSLTGSLVVGSSPCGSNSVWAFPSCPWPLWLLHSFLLFLVGFPNST